MSDYFIPKLDPSQVWTAGEYLVAHGYTILPSLMDSVKEADQMLSDPERVKYAYQSSFIVDGVTYSGIIMVTTHSFCCCSCVKNNLIRVCMPFTHHVKIGDTTGFITKQIQIECEQISVTIRAVGEHTTVKQAIQNSIENLPKQTPIKIDPHIFRQDAETFKRIKAIKDAHRSDQRTQANETHEIRSDSKEQKRTEKMKLRDLINELEEAPPSKKALTKQRIADNKAAGIACCPKCGSTSLSANKKGFGLGKAAAGALIAGPIGLIGGTLGSNKIEVTCLNCGHKFKPGK